MYKESWGLKRICPCNRIMYYDLGRKKLDCPDCGKPIEVTTLLRPRRGRKPGSVNTAPLTNPIPTKDHENLPPILSQYFSFLVPMQLDALSEEDLLILCVLSPPPLSF